MKVKITNFQSAEQAEIDIEGFTVLVGKSNIGKSAIIRAIAGALTNRKDDGFVTLGQKYAEVSLTTPTIEVLWRKGGGHNDYEINGESLESVGRGAVPHLEEAGFGEMKVGGESINVQVADQFHPLFLLNEKGSTAAEAISDVGRLSDVQEALRQSEKDRRETKSTKKVRERDVENTRQDLIKFTTYEQDMQIIAQAREKVSTALEETIAVDTLDTLEKRYTQVHAVVDHLKGAPDVLIPDWDNEGLTHLQKLEALTERGEKVHLHLEHYKGVDIVTIPADVLTDTGHMESLQALSSRHDKLRPILKFYKGVEGVEIPEYDLEGVQRDVTQLDLLETKAKKAYNLYTRMRGSDTVEIPDLESVCVTRDVETLMDMVQRLNSLASEIPPLKKEVASMDQEIEQAHVDIHTVLHDAGMCPTCDQEVK